MNNIIESDEMSFEEVKEETLQAIEHMKNAVNEWCVRDDLKKFTSWDFYNGSEMAIINVEMARDIAEQLYRYTSTLKANDSELDDIYDIVYHYAN